jgi:hypothetical protein
LFARARRYPGRAWIIYNDLVATGPIEYREPEDGDEVVVRRARARRAVWAGLLGVILSSVFMASPIVLGEWSINKYVVALGFLGACWGLSCLMHGAWDWWRGK